MAIQPAVRRSKRVASSFLVALCALAPLARAEAPPLEERVDRITVVRLASELSPDVRAEAARARSLIAEGEADGSLPPPEVMTQVWQVPLARPYALNDAQMIMFGLGQTFPAPGARGFRAAAKRETAKAGEALSASRRREAARDAEHAFADYLDAVSRHRVHREHREIAKRTFALARARHAAGGALTDVTQTELDLAKVSADVITDAARTETARARINTLLLRAPDAALGEPVAEEPAVAALSVGELVAAASRDRPELRAAESQRNARSEELHAAEREASWPTFSVAALYFAPVSPLPVHGYGVNASMSLPWLWGGAPKKRDASREGVVAAAADIEGTKLRVANEVATASASVRAAGLRLQVIRDRVLPASERAFQVAWTGYESARTDILTLLAAERAIVDARESIVMARATLDHALADLDAAVGAPVSRRPLGPMVDDDVEVSRGH